MTLVGMWRPWTQIMKLRLNVQIGQQVHPNCSGVRVQKGHTLQCCRLYSQGESAPRQTPRERPAVRKRSPGGGGYPLLIIPLTCVGLGIWQIQRRGWKLNLIQELEEKMTTQAIPLPQNLDELRQMEYRKVKVRGTFDHSRELFIGPRSNIHDAETMGSQRATNLGVHVVTPFKLADRPQMILVNRGHVTFKNQPHQMRQAGQVDGEVEITGVVRLTDRQPIMGQDAQKMGYWVSRHVEEMAEMAETSAVFIDADLNSTVPGGPQGGQTRVTLRNEHMTYIVTWFSLAAFTFFLWYKNYRSPTPHKAVVDFIKKEHRRL
ncbi:surfeit locus protein 1 [Aplysia californica]|uniref:SURF1-like protein n=1 Tax=Aplysia californica TaxID=6500 RepID=A0ABM0KAV3_APLCA|nr:surfeit locus protein 1 [Aplysia californica]